MDVVLGIDVGKTNLRVGVFSPALELLERSSVSTADIPAALAWLAERLQTLRESYAVAGAGVSIFGPLEVDAGSPDYGAVVESSEPVWSGVKVPALAARALGQAVRFDFDVNAGALGEAALGAGRDCGSFVYLSVGTGVGATFCSDERPRAGFAPQLGHTFLPRETDDPLPRGTCRFHGDCLQGLASGRAMEARWGAAAERLEPEHTAWDLEARYLARACANLVYSFSPERIVLGSSVGAAPGLAERVNSLLPKLLNGFLDPSLRRVYAGHPPVVRAQLGADSALTGAAAMARDGGGLRVFPADNR